MDAVGIGRLLRMVRLRRGWRLRDVAARARLSVASVGRHELGRIGSVDALERHSAALDLRLDLRLSGRGVEVGRLADDEHAAIVNALAHAFGAGAWATRAEASYSEWGERGRIDLLAGRAGRLAVTEVKTELGDLQEMLGALDVRERLAPTVARRMGWEVAEVVVVLALASTRRNRALVRAHVALFRSFAQRTFRGGDPAPRSPRTLLWIPPETAGRRMWLAGRRQVRGRKRGRPLSSSGRG